MEPDVKFWIGHSILILLLKIQKDRFTAYNQEAKGTGFKKIIGFCKTERINLTISFLTVRMDFR